jgi:hypothetical protein
MKRGVCGSHPARPHFIECFGPEGAEEPTLVYVALDAICIVTGGPGWCHAFLNDGGGEHHLTKAGRDALVDLGCSGLVDAERQGNQGGFE